MYEKELAELNTPYTADELCLHSKDRQMKNILEEIHAHNWRLINLAQHWIDYFAGLRSRPVYHIWEYAYPGYDRDPNRACDLINSLRDQIIAFGEGKCPKM